MAPSVQVASQPNPTLTSKGIQTVPTESSASSIAPKAPLKASGLLDSLYASEELTPALGRLYPEIQLRDVLHHEKADELLRDIAIIISRRGVVFFKNQDLTAEEQKYITNRLGHLTGKPASSGLHVHPVFNAEREGKDQVVDDKGTTNKDNEISVISSNLLRSLQVGPRTGANEWHSDISFESVPADYTSLKIHTLPHTGGDTLWGSGYEVYDLLSPPMQQLAERLTARYHTPVFGRSAEEYGYQIHPGPRGAAENVGTHLSAVHPIVRTNPITGWKSIFAVGHHMEQINDVSEAESDLLRKYFLDVLTQNHTTQVRYRWSKNDLAIWDNRSTYHAATPDYFHIGPRSGVRAVSCGERPYYDPRSTSRRADLNGRLV
ncbi:hypothetical protein CBS9595_002943 [Malassezia furfur]|nr:hypothetical protein CBS9595_002943 [Malassezia furfur]